MKPTDLNGKLKDKYVKLINQRTNVTTGFALPSNEKVSRP
jgi:hypothetical protein